MVLMVVIRLSSLIAPSPTVNVVHCTPPSSSRVWVRDYRSTCTGLFNSTRTRNAVSTTYIGLRLFSLGLSIKNINGSKQQLHITAHKISFLFFDHVVQEQYELRVTDSSEFSDLVTQTLCSAARLGRDYHYVYCASTNDMLLLASK